MNKKLQFAFLVSLLVNVLLVGVLLGQLPERVDRGSSRGQRMEEAIAELPEPLQARFCEKMEPLREDRESLRNQIQEARDEAIRLLVTEPFDEAAYDRQVNKIHELRGLRAKRMAEVVKAVAKDSPLEQREMLAEMLKRPPPPPAK